MASPSASDGGFLASALESAAARFCASGEIPAHLCQGDTAWVFLLALAMIAGSVWMLFLDARLPVPRGLRRGVTRLVLEIANDWLRLFGGVAACFFLPLGVMLALACLSGGLAFWHWPVALAMFAALMVWRLR